MNEKESYFVVIQRETEAQVYEYTRAQLQVALNDKTFEDALGALPKESSTAYWDGRPLIIKGSIIVPRALKAVVAWDID